MVHEIPIWHAVLTSQFDAKPVKVLVFRELLVRLNVALRNPLRFTKLPIPVLAKPRCRPFTLMLVMTRVSGFLAVT